MQKNVLSFDLTWTVWQEAYQLIVWSLNNNQCWKSKAKTGNVTKFLPRPISKKRSWCLTINVIYIWSHTMWWTCIEVTCRATKFDHARMWPKFLHRFLLQTTNSDHTIISLITISNQNVNKEWMLLTIEGLYCFSVNII